MIPVAKAIVALAGAYLVTGAVVGLAFLIFRIDRHDAAGRGAYAFRPLLLPGLALLWPIVVLRWMSPPGPPAATSVNRHKRAHRAIWMALALFIVAIIALSSGIRPAKPPDNPSLRLGQAAGVTA